MNKYDYYMWIDLNLSQLCIFILKSSLYDSSGLLPFVTRSCMGNFHWETGEKVYHLENLVIFDENPSTIAITDLFL